MIKVSRKYQSEDKEQMTTFVNLCFTMPIHASDLPCISNFSVNEFATNKVNNRTR